MTDSMDKQEKLYSKISMEEKTFLDSLKKLSVEQLINMAYQITLKEDICTILKEELLTDDEIDKLLSMECVVDNIYCAWLKYDYSIMEDLRDTIKSFCVKHMKSEATVNDGLRKK